MDNATTRTALVTGASRGLGRALTSTLLQHGWHVVATARTAEDLRRIAPSHAALTGILGDVTDPAHRLRLARAVGARLDLLVTNASDLGPSPLPRLADVDPVDLATVLDVNVVAPLSLFQHLAAALGRAGGTVINVSSDAAQGDWPGWGVYAASKAALDRLTAVLASEHPDLAVYAVDPGDMRTRMHADAFPGEDISDRPDPETVVPHLLHLLAQRPPSRRYLASELPPVAEVPA